MVVYQASEKFKEEMKAYRKFAKEINKKRKRDALLKYYETIRDNPDYFDREYYVKQLEAKGFKF